MTDGTRRPAGAGARGGIPTRRSRTFAPELVAAILSAIVVAVVAGGLVVGRTSAVVTPATSAEPTPGLDSTPGPTPAVDETAITALLALNDRLTTARESLDAALGASFFEASDVATVLRSLNADVVNASEIAPILAAVSGLEDRRRPPREVLRRPASARLGCAGELGSERDRRTAPPAKSTSAILAEVPALNAALEALLIGRAPPSSSPPPSVSAPPSNGPPGIDPAAGSVRIAARDRIAGPFRRRVGAGLAGRSERSPEPGLRGRSGPALGAVRRGTGAATWTTDLAVHAGGGRRPPGSTSAWPATSGPRSPSARVGSSIAAGSRYVATIAVRADTTREVRLRIASAAGDTYATRLFTVGPAWQVLTVDSTVFATDPNAYLEVDLGRFAATTWLDDASFAQVAATGG